MAVVTSRQCKVFINGLDLTHSVVSIAISAKVGELVETTSIMRAMPRIIGTEIHLDIDKSHGIAHPALVEQIRGITLRDT